VMKRKHVILLHILVWALLILSDAIPNFIANNYSSYQNMPKDASLLIRYLLVSVGFTLIGMSGFYSSYLLVAPQILLKKNYIKALLFTCLVIAGMIGLRYTIEYGFFIPVLNFDNYKGVRWPATRYIENALYYYLPRHVVYGIIYFFVEEWQANKQRQQELQQEKTTAELTFLRSQINPHFLFNTINDIYALTYQKSDLAPQALLKLSELLRYMLREGQQETTLLTNEIDYLNNVIELQRISAKGNAYINFNSSGIANTQKVASLLFIAFVENAFKHGVLNDADNPVQMNLNAAGEQLHFTISNKINSYQKDHTGGIGLANVTRRLDLMYDGKYQLHIKNDGNYYQVDLTLNT
jgi:two-component system LytT family sensor kinase